MSATAEVQSGLEGVVAFATEIAEPDREGGALRYRGVDIEELVGPCRSSRSGACWSTARCCRACRRRRRNALSVRSGDPRVDVQAALAMLGPQWGFRQLIDIADEEARDNLARASVMALSFVAQSARGHRQPPVSQREIDKATSIPERFLHPLARRGRPQARQGDRRLLELRRRARDERLHLHRARRRLDRRRRGRRPVRRRRRAVGPAARRRPRRAC